MKKYTRFILLGVLLSITFLTVNAGIPTLRSVDTTGDVGSFTDIDLSSNNFAYASYRDETNDNLKLLVCSSAICDSFAPYTVDSSTNVGEYTSLQLNNGNLPIISYYDRNSTSLKMAFCNDNNDCDSPTFSTVDNAADVGQYSSIALRAGNVPTVAYYDVTNQDLKIAFCTTGSNCSPSTPVTLDSTGNVGQYASLALASGDIPVIAYYDATNTDIKLVRCAASTDCTTRTINSISSANNIGQFLSLALNSSGFPIISYYDATSQDLMLAVCSDPTCTTAPTTFPVDTAGNVGQYTSVQMATGNIPVISYHDVTNGDLKFARCNASNSCTAPTLVQVDQTGTTGLYSSLALNGSGNPLMTYYDTTTDDHKIAVCDNESCNVASEYSSNPAAGSTIAFTGTSGSSVSQTITVSNTGDTVAGLDVSLNSITTGYTILSTLPITGLLTTTTQNITISCSIPTDNGTLVLNTNDPTNPTIRYNLTCGGSSGGGGNTTTAEFTSVPAPGNAIDMGIAIIGQSVSTNIVITETGAQDLNITLAGDLITGEHAAEFAATGDVPPFTIQDGGAAKTITITCTPTEVGIRSATLIFNSNATNQPSATYNLSCSGASVTQTNDPSNPENLINSGRFTTTYARVTTTGLAYRTGPYLGATMLGVIRPEIDFPVLGQSNDEGGDYTWYLLEVGEDNDLVWASGRHLTLLGPPATIPTVTSIFDEIDNPIDLQVRAEVFTNLNVRRRPSERSQILATSNWGDEFIIYGRTRQAGQDIWYHVNYNGTIGWVIGGFMEITTPRFPDITPIR